MDQERLDYEYLAKRFKELLDPETSGERKAEILIDFKNIIVALAVFSVVLLVGIVGFFYLLGGAFYLLSICFYPAMIIICGITLYLIFKAFSV